uniref:Uncharacterized protein n=1 Tax=Lepeophtheirus salmonis TaxID=72036 RepID=A0A0K2V849_LEPSM
MLSTSNFVFSIDSAPKRRFSTF